MIQIEEITSHIDPEEGWQDIFLTIVSKEELNTSTTFIGKGIYKEELVGLKIELVNGMAAGLLPAEEINRDAFYRNGIQFYSIGFESNSLVRALSDLYNFPTIKPFTTATISATVFSLNDINVDFSSREYFKFKLFFNDDSEILYAELFCNIDLNRGIIELHEKDEEYRENIIKILTQ